MFILADNDFDSFVRQKKSGTLAFLERLIVNIAAGLAFCEIRPKRKMDLVCPVGLSNGKTITLVGIKRKHASHRELQAADIILGIYNDSFKFIRPKPKLHWGLSVFPLRFE